MIIRKLADALREQNWLTFVFEVVVVVVGIFIGLQVDKWNQARNDRIDESAFIARLHGEMTTSAGFAQTIGERQRNSWLNVISALDVVFARSNRDELSDDECGAIGRSAFMAIVTVDLPTLGALTSSGSVAVIQDTELSLALARLKQLSVSTRNLFDAASATHLFVKYPDIVQAEGYWSEQENELRIRYQCDLPAMRKDRGFLNDFSINADSFDGFYNKGIKRELEQLERIHELVDEFLSINHQGQTS